MKTILLFFFALITLSGRSQDANPLFTSQQPLSVKITGSIKSIKKNTNDSTFIVGKFMYKGADGSWVIIPTEARTRGNFRLKNCYFPPLKLKLNKQDVASTAFAGNKALKLVVPCKNTGDKNELIRREYLCYKFYELLAPYHFRTRLADIELNETSGKKTRVYTLLGFFVEDNSLVAKRGNAKVVEVKGMSPSVFDDRNSVRNDFFQFMIGNADWSAIYQHNSNVLFAETKYIVLPYDFDMAGFVNAHYARENPPNLGTGDPRERVYRGFCRPGEVMEEVRKEFLNKEKELHALVDAEKDHFAKYSLQDMHNYLDDFFTILRNDAQFKRAIVEQCR